MAFDDVRLPVDYEKGATGGPEFSTTIVNLSGGGEARNQDWSRARATYSISYGIDDKGDYDQLIAFFYCRRGKTRGFRFKDWVDYKLNNEPLAGLVNGSNAVFQMQKEYDDGSGNVFIRKISRPVAGFSMYDNGVLVAPADYTVGAKGLITFDTPPTSGHAITCTGEFDVPVRFDTDRLPRVAETEFALSFSSINIREIIE